MNGTIFWQNINALIKKQNTTQEWLCQKCGLNLGTFKNKSSNKTVFDAISAYKIAQALNTTVEYLITGQDSNPYKIELDELKTNLRNLLDYNLAPDSPVPR